MGRQEDENKERGNWENKWEYLLSLAGYAIGIGNVWRFPYLCYRNGGGAFLFPYLVMLFVVGLPLFLLESSLGQFSSSGCLALYNVSPIFKGIGYTSMLVSLIASTYYSVVVAYPIVFLFHSISSKLPWASCDNSWNTERCSVGVYFGNASSEMANSSMSESPAHEFFFNNVLQISEGIEHPDGLLAPLVNATLFVWVVVFLCIFKGVKVVGKVVWVTTTFPFLMLFILFCRGVTLPGALDGIKYYIYPDFNKIFELRVWADAAVQIFFSLGPGFGSLVTMSSFNRFRNNCQRDALFVPILNCATSIFAGFVVFSVLGYMANSSQKAIEEVTTAGPSLAFITYPAALSLLPMAPVWSVLFFLMVFFLGIDSIFVQIEAMVVSLIDEFPNQRRRKALVTFASCLVMFLLALFCCTRGGMYVIQILDTFSATVPIIFSCVCEIMVFAYVYGGGSVVRDVEMMTNKPVSHFWYTMWQIFTPAILVFIFLNTLATITPGSLAGYFFPQWSVVVGWMTAVIPMSTIPLYAIYYLLTTKGSFSKRLDCGLSATPAWGPALENHRNAWLEYIKVHPLRHRLLHPRIDTLWGGRLLAFFAPKNEKKPSELTREAEEGMPLSTKPEVDMP